CRAVGDQLIAGGFDDFVCLLIVIIRVFEPEVASLPALHGGLVTRCQRVDQPLDLSRLFLCAGGIIAPRDRVAVAVRAFFSASRANGQLQKKPGWEDAEPQPQRKPW